MVKEHEQNPVHSFQAFLEEGLDGLLVNAQYVRSRWQMWVFDQKIKARIWKKRPDLRWSLWRYPAREPLPPAFQQLYRKTVRDVKRALEMWHNPWIMVPSCSFALTTDGLASYNTYRHDIKVALVFRYWYCQVNIFLPRLRRAMKMVGRGEHYKVPWVKMGERMLWEATTYKEVYEELETAEYFTHLPEIWACFLQELPPLLAECERSGLVPEGLLLWCEELVQFYRYLQQCLRSTFVHELIHAWTRWIAYRDGKITYRVMGLEDRRWDQPEVDASLAASRVHTGLNEALTEWITERLDAQIYGKAQLVSWRGIVFSTIYPAWIIEYLVQALDYHWLRLVAALPLLAECGIANATDFLYTLYFADARLVACFKDALTLLGGGDNESFTKLSDACDHFCLNRSFDQVVMEQSFRDLQQLLTPVIDHLRYRGERNDDGTT